MKNKKGFTFVELMVVIVILGILSVIGISSFTSSQRKSRDVRRKADLAQIAKVLEMYYNDAGQYPTGGTNGEIMGCGTGGVNSCTWGDPFINETTGTLYMKELPKDPASNYFYYYESAGTSYALYARLENADDPDIGIYSTICGLADSLCNYALTSSGE